MEQEHMNREERAEKEQKRVRNNRIALILGLVALLIIGGFLSNFDRSQSSGGQASTENTREEGLESVMGKPGADETAKPDPTESEKPDSGSTEPETTIPPATKTDTNGAETTEPETTEPEMTEPETTEPETTEPVLRNFIVCLDAGHGGNHGAISPLDGRFESDDTLRLTLAVQRELAKYGDVTVVMTRTEDVDVDNGVRAEIANKAGADLFISIHRNSNTTGTTGGIEGWIHSSNPADSRAAGEMILAAMEQVGVTANWGVKTGTWDEPAANYKVIRLAEMPAVLLEVGYVNYAKDNELFDQNLDKYAAAAAKAVYEWLKEWVFR